MAELLLTKNTGRGYDAGDIVYIAEDNHAWSNAELNTNNFEIVKGVTLSEMDRSLLHQDDQQFDHSIDMVLSFINEIEWQHNVKQVKRRRYQYSNGVKRKNA